MKGLSALRCILINALTREQLIDFIKSKSSAHAETNFTQHTDKQLRQLAVFIDSKTKEGE